MKPENRDLIMAAGFLLLLVMSGSNEKEILPAVQGDWDIAEQVKLSGNEQYLVEEVDFDYSNPQIQLLAAQLKSSSPNSFEAVKATAKYVVNNIKYSSKISIGYCYDETASHVLDVGYGDCVSMSRLATSLLRAQGIPARTMGGCLSSYRGCSALFAVDPLLEAKVTPMMSGDFKKRGFLHEWVEVWTPEKGWYVLEATAGQLFPLGCQTYINYGYDSTKYDRCVIQDSNFWNLCSAS